MQWKKKGIVLKNNHIMSIDNPQKSFLPQCDGRALDFIKICAAIFMVIDHMNFLWFRHEVFPMQLIGRGVFPLFCYAVAVAVMKAGVDGSGRYITRLLVLSALVQPVYQLAMGIGYANVIFTLASGAAFAAFSYKATVPQMYMLYICAAISMLLPNIIEYGMAGIMLPSAIVLAMRGQKCAYPFLILLLLFINAGGMLETFRQGMAINALTIYSALGLASILLPLLILNIARDMEQTGRYLSKYSLHVFYPAHMALLKVIGMVFFK